MPNEFDLLQFFSQQIEPVPLEHLLKQFSDDPFVTTPLFELIKSGYVEESGEGTDKQYQVTEKGKNEQITRDSYRKQK